MALGLDRAEVGQPLVVDVAADGGVLVVDVVLAAHRHGAERRVGDDERDRLAVLAAVEDDLGGDAVGVEVAHARVRVVVAFGRVQRVEPAHPALLLDERGEVVEVVEVLLGAVGPQVFAQPRADVGVARDDDDLFAGRRCRTALACSCGAPSIPPGSTARSSSCGATCRTVTSRSVAPAASCSMGGSRLSPCRHRRSGSRATAAGVDTGLVAWDPERYGSLSIPNHDLSYGIFTDVVRAVGRDARARRSIRWPASTSVTWLPTASRSRRCGWRPTTTRSTRLCAVDGYLLVVYPGYGTGLSSPRYPECGFPVSPISSR